MSQAEVNFKNSEFRSDLYEKVNFELQKQFVSKLELRGPQPSTQVVRTKHRRKKKALSSAKECEEKVIVKTENEIEEERHDVTVTSQWEEVLTDSTNSEEKLRGVFSGHSIKKEIDNETFKDSEYTMYDNVRTQQSNSMYDNVRTQQSNSMFDNVRTQQSNSNVDEPLCCLYSSSPSLLVNHKDLCPNFTVRSTERKYVHKYQATVKRRSTEKNCSCNICGAVFTRKNSLNRHLRIHTGERPHKCNICSALFNRKNSLNRHRRVHTGLRPYKCHICWASFTLKQGLVIHQQTHLRNVSFKDKMYIAAPERFNVILNDKTYVIAHVKHGEKETVQPTERYIQDFEESQKCSEVNKDMSQINSHFEEDKTCHQEIKTTVRRSQKYLKEIKADLNRTKKHTAEASFQCYICDSVFTRRNSLNRHQTVHTGDKPFQCNICCALFARKNSLKRHQRIHTREKPFKCNVCSAYFAQKMHLVVHERIHTGEKPYKCNVCSAFFTVRKGLVVHTKIHHYNVSLEDQANFVTLGRKIPEKIDKITRVNESNFSCHICNAVFTRKNSLNRHLVIHTGEKPYQCDICSAVFTRKNSLYRHKKIHIRDDK